MVTKVKMRRKKSKRQNGFGWDLRVCALDYVTLIARWASVYVSS